MVLVSLRSPDNNRTRHSPILAERWQLVEIWIRDHAGDQFLSCRTYRRPSLAYRHTCTFGLYKTSAKNFKLKRITSDQR